MAYTERTTTSWFSRLKNALIGILAGFILVLAAIYFLFWNEGRSVATYRSLAEGAGLVVSVDNGAADPANEGKLIHISGPVKMQGTPRDGLFDIAADGAAGLQRDVEMYQWVEEKETKSERQLGGGEETVTTYSYRKEWHSGRVNSDTFRERSAHENPQATVESAGFSVPSLTIGAFSIDGKAAARLGDSSPLALMPEDTARIQSALSTSKPVVMTDSGRVVVSSNPQNPAIGDLRISFTRADLAQASFVGAQTGSGLKGYRTTNGRTIFLSASGIEDATALFDAARSENGVITWIIRVAGLVGIFVGFVLMLSILGVIADVIPFAGSIVRFGTSAIAAILTLLIGPLVIAVAWFANRPVLAVSVIAGGIAIAAGILYLRRGSSPTTRTPLGRPSNN